MTLIETLANWLADMPGLSLPIFPMQFSSTIKNCIGIFPTGGGVQGNIGVGPGYFSDGGVLNAFDYPGAQVQVRYENPNDAFLICEQIRLWLDMNPPTGYLMIKTNRSQPDDLTSTSDAEADIYRFSCEFSFIKVRS